MLIDNFTQQEKLLVNTKLTLQKNEFWRLTQMRLLTLTKLSIPQKQNQNLILANMIM